MKTAHEWAAAEILSVLLRLPASDRMTVFALATRAALDAGLLDDVGDNKDSDLDSVPVEETTQ